MNDAILVLRSQEITVSGFFLKDIHIVLKRLFDIIFACIGLILFLPILFFVKIAYLLTFDTKPIIYKHKRVGFEGREIGIYKFRTMVSDANNFEKYFTKKQLIEFKKNFKLDNDPRITKIGKFLRKTSLDELPQVLNVLKGEMSLIGPRPVVSDEIKKYGKYKELFLSVKPGLTGWWACNGRSSTTYEDRIRLELFYCRNISMSLDIKCFFKTIISLIKREGAK